MSTNGFLTRRLDAFISVVKTPLWATLAIAEGVLTLIATALTVFNDGSNFDGLDAGRMAFSFVTLITLAFVLFTAPAIVDRVRNSSGFTGLVSSLLISSFTVVTLVAAAIPALTWAILATGVSPALWGPAFGALWFEAAVVIVLTSLAFGHISKSSVATALAYSAIGSLLAVPLLALGVVSVMPGVTQTTYTWPLDWGKNDGSDIDPVTGFPRDPKCPDKVASTRTVARTDLIWAAVPTIPFAFVSESVEPKVVQYVNDMTVGGATAAEPLYKSSAPVDLFSTISLATRALQITPETTIEINECTLLKETGSPYSTYPYTLSPTVIQEHTHSGFVAGLVGQAIVLAVWSAGLVFIPRIRRKK